jgi:H+-transporting ATPase
MLAPSPASQASRPDLSYLLANESLPRVLSLLEATSAGLTSGEAETRAARYGPNALPEHRVNPVLKFLSYFWGPIPWMIEVAALLSCIVGHWADLAIILVLLVVNGIVGFWEEYHAGNAVAALKATLSLQARVRRDGSWHTIPSRELVPGDIVRIRIGDVVPADVKLLEPRPMEFDQSALTGESLPVTRSQGEVAYSGAVVKRGEGDAVVYAIGSSTFFGKAAQLVQDARVVSHFQRAILKIGDVLILIAVVLVALILLVSLFRGDPFLKTLQFALVLTVAAVPVALPTVLSVTMAAGARLLAKRRAIVTRLAAIEELAGVEVLCSDKTGTLTQNRLTLGEPFVMPGCSRQDLIAAAALASRAEDQDAIDAAILSAKDIPQDLGSRFRVIDFQPFDPVRKRTEAKVQPTDGPAFAVSKGAPQVILALASDRHLVEQRLGEAVQGFADKGFRSLAVARRDDEDHWRLLGVLPLLDPPREDSKQTIEDAHALGVTVKMITGDQVAIAREVSREIGLGDRILDTRDLGDGEGDWGRVASDLIEQSDGFAQVYPEHKYKIVESLQESGLIVGMTGDGVNDAPALKKADAGIAVSGATDAARAAADIVLLTPGLSVIIDAIRESRRIFQRMNSYAIYRIAETIRVLLLMTLAILVFNFYPVTAVMIVMLALLNDGAILSIAYDRVRPSPEPEAWNMPRVLSVAGVLGVTGVIASFGLFYLAERVFQIDREHIQTILYLKLSVAGHLTIFVARTRGPFWSIRPATSLLLAVIATQVVATLIAVYGVLMAPIGWGTALLIWGYSLAWFLINDAMKLLVYRVMDPERTLLLQRWRTRRSRGA